MVARPTIQARAHRHMREAQAFGWHAKSQICDYAVAALEAEGYDETNAASTVEVIWARNFTIQPPI